MKKIVWGLLLTGIFFTGCQNKKQQNKAATQKEARQESKATEKKEKQKKEPVDLNKPIAVYRANEEDVATNNDFIVKAYPTNNPEEFRIVMQFGENKAEDDVEFPDPKYYKKVALRKGDKVNTCLLGFIGKDGKFNEMKAISGSATQIKITSLKAYYFTTKEN